MSKEISIDEIIQKYCDKKCGKNMSLCYKPEKPDICESVQIFRELLDGCTITQKTNSELAEDLYVEGIEFEENSQFATSTELYRRAYELLKKGDE